MYQTIKFSTLLVLIILTILRVVEARVYKSAETNQSNVEEDDGKNLKPISRASQDHKDVCPGESVCVVMVSCPAHVRSTNVTYCNTIGGRKGICCSSGRNHTENVRGKGRHHWHMLDPAIMGVITRHSQSEMAELKTHEEKLLSSGFSTVLSHGSASYSHFRNSRAFNFDDLSEVVNVANRALEIAFATKAFKNRQGLTNQQLEVGDFHEDLVDTDLAESCTAKPFCPSIMDKYRRIDGACNNLVNTGWGAPFTPYARLLPPTYQDGIWSPRVSVINNRPLPSPRFISKTIFPDKDIPNPEFTLMLMQFGQFLSHDLTQSIDTSYANGSAISCCASDGSGALPREYRHYACMPIEIPETDKFYGVFKQKCMNFVRSVLAPRQDCTLGYAQQMNKITHFIDGSNIYGSTPEQTSELRSLQGGKLIVFKDFGRDLLPLSKDPDACLTMEQGSACFISGDTRSNQMISLAALHILFHREHNRVAEELHKLNPQWEDEMLFLEARRIVIGEIQTIVYKEFLPAVIGEVTMAEFKLNLGGGEQYSYDYDISVEPSVTNEFATAALRFGHSMVEGLLKVYGPRKMEEMISIPEVMFHPARMRKRLFLDELLSTLTTEPIQEVDNSISEGLTKYMFRAGNPFGVDLASLNIQRGRDHGIRPYNDYRELTGQSRIQSFQEYPPEIAEKLETVYASVDDIDLWVGGLLEQKAPGSLVGPTFRDIIADQFARLKKGDKYFFENDPTINPGYFTPEQLREIRQSSMSRIVCDNSDGILIGRQAPNAFRRPGVPGNDFVDCESQQIPRVNLKYWKQ